MSTNIEVQHVGTSLFCHLQIHTDLTDILNTHQENAETKTQNKTKKYLRKDRKPRSYEVDGV